MIRNFTHFQRRALLSSLFVLGSFVFINCSSDDDTPPPPPIVEEFEEVEDLDPVTDPEPAVTEPDTGEVAQSEETESIAADILGNSETGEVTAETEASLAKVEEVAAALPPAVTEAANALDETAVDNILDATQELDGDLAELQAGMEELPEEVKALLPVINFSMDFEGMAVAAALKSGEIFTVKDIEIIAQVTGSCFELNQDAYDAVIEKLTTQLDANLATIEANYTRRVQEAETRYTDRLALQAERYETTKAAIKVTVMSLIQAADVLTFLGLHEMAAQVNMLALLYTVEARTALNAWDASVKVVIENFKTAELATALQLKTAKTAEATAAFNAAKAQATQLLNEALAECHDQGSGN